MTDRLKGVTVTFKTDIREDDAEATINAIRMIKGVLSVDPIMANYQDHVARVRLKHEISDKLYKVIEEI